MPYIKATIGGDMKSAVFFAVVVTVIASCSSGHNYIRNVDEVRDIGLIRQRNDIDNDNAREILDAYTIDFEIPNPLYGEMTSFGRTDPRRLGTIFCRAVLLDDAASEADIHIRFSGEPPDGMTYEDFREKYLKERMREGMFRIQITMVSGFSDKSMELEHWALYLENAQGVMIEPSDVAVSPVHSVRDSVYSEYQRLNIPRNALRRDVTLYFKRITFFGEDLFGPGNSHIVFVVSREKKTLARIAWNLSKEPKKALSMPKEPEEAFEE